MPGTVTFLHVTDPHIAADGTPLTRDDLKAPVPGIDHVTREDALDLLCARIAQRLTSDGRVLDGVLFTGDAQDRGRPGGHKLVLEILLRNFATLGITPPKIVAVPGNHDIPRGSAPSSAARYEAFIAAWRSAGCVTPWLDGVDAKAQPGSDHSAYRLISSDRRWAVFPINTSNWSNVTATLPEPLRGMWGGIPKILADGDAAKEVELRKQLDALAAYDMARVSPEQLEALRTIIDETPRPPDGAQLRIAIQHHHLRAPGLREELKPFADVSNLEQLRAFLRDRGIDVVLHGHKHEHAAQFEHIYDHQGERDHRMLVISGATFSAERETDAARLITFEGLPATPRVRIEPFPLPRAGIEMPRAEPIVRQLWIPAAPLPGQPTIIQGTDINEVYDRACAAASNEAANGILIVHLDLPSDDPGSLPLPVGYPAPEPITETEKQTWLRELVTWWQLDHSQLQHRIPYVHGSRLRRFGGKINQIARIIRLLEHGTTTRALAVVVDPSRDFGAAGEREEFASFCLVGFRRRKLAAGRDAIDCIAFYRAQEFARWWPINVAELRHLQREIGRALSIEPGRITTIAGDARSISKSPTQVAMPIIDRWLDQAPERLHLLATALVHKMVRPGVQQQAIQDWERCLTDLQQAATKFNADGIPVAIEGLEMLASYLEVARNEDDAELDTMAQVLKNLAGHNRTFDQSARDLTRFNGWSPMAKQFTAQLQELTRARLSSSI